MSRVFKVILGLSLLASSQTDAAAGRFARAAWKFVKAPSIALGTVGSGASYTTMKKHFNEDIEISKQQTKKLEEALHSPIANISREAQELLKKHAIIKEKCAETGVKIDHVLIESMSSPFAIAKLDNRTLLSISPLSSCLDPQVVQHALEHECSHARHEDFRNVSHILSTIPLQSTLWFRLAKLKGKNNFFALGSCALGALMHKQLHSAYSRHIEFRADLACKDPSALEEAAKYMEENKEEEQEDIAFTRKCLPLKERCSFELNIALDTLLNNTHPDLLDRAHALRKQSKKLRAEEEINK